MGRLRRLGYSATVALLVFTVLSLPILSRLYGPVVYLPAYALVSIVAGVATWSLLRWLAGGEERSSDVDLAEPVETGPKERVDVDAEIEQLREEE